MKTFLKLLAEYGPAFLKAFLDARAAKAAAEKDKSDA
jgi:hypothetical protein